jgi:hypothetical protein
LRIFFFQEVYLINIEEQKVYDCEFSLQAAIEQATMLNHHYSNGSVSMDGVEDLSMKSSRNNSSDNLRKLGSPSRCVLISPKSFQSFFHWFLLGFVFCCCCCLSGFFFFATIWEYIKTGDQQACVGDLFYYLKFYHMRNPKWRKSFCCILLFKWFWMDCSALWKLMTAPTQVTFNLHNVIVIQFNYFLNKLLR